MVVYSNFVSFTISSANEVVPLLSLSGKNRIKGHTIANKRIINGNIQTVEPKAQFLLHFLIKHTCTSNRPIRRGLRARIDTSCSVARENVFILAKVEILILSATYAVTIFQNFEFSPLKRSFLGKNLT